MYYKIYEIKDSNQKYDFANIRIIRFSINKFKINDDDDDDDIEKTKDLLNEFIKIAQKDVNCYNSIYPWEDIDHSNNMEILIAYNIISNHIQGWCNLFYSKINSEKVGSLYTLQISKLVSREIPKDPKYVGLLLLEFVKDICFDKPIYFKDINGLSRIQLDIMYLYSLTSSIDFYKRTYLTNITKTDASHQDYNLLQHVFMYLSEKYKTNIGKKLYTLLTSLEILHSFEIDSKINKEEIMKYKNFIPNRKCLNNNPITNYNILSLPVIVYNSNIVFNKKKIETHLTMSDQELSIREKFRKKIRSSISQK